MGLGWGAIRSYQPFNNSENHPTPTPSVFPQNRGAVLKGLTDYGKAKARPQLGPRERATPPTKQTKNSTARHVRRRFGFLTGRRFFLSLPLKGATLYSQFTIAASFFLSCLEAFVRHGGVRRAWRRSTRKGVQHFLAGKTFFSAGAPKT